MYGICKLSFVPVRAESSSKSELVTQLILGEIYKVISQKDDWYFIENQNDSYTGWINLLQHSPLINMGLLTEKPIIFNTYPLEVALNHTLQQKQIIPFGANIFQLINGNELTEFMIDNYNFSFQNFYISANSNLIDSAKKFLNVPYLWGGKSSMGIDCSGFSQIIFKSHGIQLKRDAFQQAQQGEVVDFLSVSSPGDLAFFDNNEGKITHVGILLNNAEIIHASGQVKIEKIDNYGIINNETNQYSHKLRMIRRILK